MIVLGLTGLAAAGKGEVSDYLKSKGFEKFVFSDVLRIEAGKRGISLDVSYEEQKKILSELGDTLRKETGKMEILAMMLVIEIQSKNLEKVVVDGFRSIEEVEVFRSNFKEFKLIYIDTPEEVRFKRRQLDDKKADLKRFRERDKIDIKALRKIKELKSEGY